MAKTAEKTTIYCVQSFWRDGRKLAQGELRQFKKEPDAMRVGESLARRNAGSIVYSVTGNAEFDDWSEPRLLARHGETPAIEFA